MRRSSMVIAIGVAAATVLLAAAPSALAQPASPPAADVAVPSDCDSANAADAGCKALAPRGTVAPPSGEGGRHGTCETMDGSKVEWSQPNVPFGVARCDPTETAPKPQEKSPQGK